MSALRAIVGWAFGLLGVALPAWLLPVILVAAGLSVMGGAYLKGRADSNANCQAAQLAAELASMKRDRDVAAAAEKDASHMAAALATENAKLAQEVETYAAELAKRPPSQNCKLNTEDVKRIRGPR